MRDLTAVETVPADVAPDAREIEWRERRTSHPTDALRIGDPYAALAEAYRQSVSYRELAQRALAMVAQLTAKIERLTETIGRLNAAVAGQECREGRRA